MLTTTCHSLGALDIIVGTHWPPCQKLSLYKGTTSLRPHLHYMVQVTQFWFFSSHCGTYWIRPSTVIRKKTHKDSDTCICVCHVSRQIGKSDGGKWRQLRWTLFWISTSTFGCVNADIGYESLLKDVNWLSKNKKGDIVNKLELGIKTYSLNAA